MARQYLKLSFNIQHTQEGELLIALLSDLPFDSFEEEDSQLLAYIPEEDFTHAAVEEALANLPEHLQHYQSELVEEQNWNSIWESSFEPIVVDDRCGVRAPFNNALGTNIEIIIEPKMAFGTGHHATTYMMMKLMLDLDFKNKKVFDFGCGSGILAILAKKLGAGHTLAIDNDEWAYDNTLENIGINNTSHMQVMHGSIEITDESGFDIILANITRNTIEQYFGVLYDRLVQGGHLLVSGILNSDVEHIQSLATAKGMSLAAQENKDNWAALHFKKQN